MATKYPIITTVSYDKENPAPGDRIFLDPHRTETVREFEDRFEIVFMEEFCSTDNECHELEIKRVVSKTPGEYTRLYLDDEHFGLWEQGDDHEGLSDIEDGIVRFGVDQAVKSRCETVLSTTIEEVDEEGRELSVEVYWKPDFMEPNPGQLIWYYDSEDNPPISIKRLVDGEVVWKTEMHSRGAEVVDFCEVDSLDELEPGCFYVADTDVYEDGEEY